MCVLVVGGDQISQIRDELKHFGVMEVLHWNCRKRSEANRPVPQRVDCILMLTSFLKHSTMKKMKSEAKRNGLPAIYAKRSRVDVNQSIKCSSCDLFCDKRNGAC